MRLSIIGLGKLGAPMAAVMAHKGHSVTGVDLDPFCVERLNRGEAPVNEPGLQDLIASNRERLFATQDIGAAVLSTDVTFIVVPTPSDSDGRFSLNHVLEVAQPAGEALRRKSEWHLMVLSSTVMPGSTESVLLPELERISGKKCGPGFGLCYNPEFIALGTVVRDLLNPDMVLIGESDQRSGEVLEALYKQTCENRPQIRRMNFVNAELTKLSVNTFVTTKISYANMLAEICETLPGADAGVVTAALGCDTRIGAKYLMGAVGYGGPCFPRDNLALAALARDNAVPALLAEATDAVNRRQIPHLLEAVLAALPSGGTAGVLGLSYKPGTDVIEESQGLGLAKLLSRTGLPVVVYDPAAMDNARLHLGPGVTFAPSLADCASQADVLVIATPWPEFRSLCAENLKCGAWRPVIVDCWRILDPENFRGRAEYRMLGQGPSTSGKARAAGRAVTTQ